MNALGSSAAVEKEQTTWWFILAAIAALAVAQQVAYGIDFFSWRHYGFSLKMSNAVQAVLNPDQMIIRHYFDVWSTPIYERPYVFVAASLLLRVAELFLVFLISLEVCRERRVALIALALVSFAFGIDRWPQNGVIGHPIFLAAGVSSCFSLAGLYLMQRGSWLPAGILVGLAPHFHPLHGLAVIPVVTLAALMWASSAGNRQRLFGVGTYLIAVLVTISPLVVRRGLDIAHTDLTRPEWFRFVITRDPDDALALYSISHVGLPILGAAMFYLYVRRRRSSSLLEYVLFAAVLFFPACALFEWAEIHGTFSGRVSELITAIEFRRGLWLAAVSVIPLVVAELFQRSSPSEWSLVDAVLLAGFIALIQLTAMNVAVGFIVLLAVGLVASRRERSGVFLGALGACGLLVSTLRYFPGIAAGARPLTSAGLFLVFVLAAGAWWVIAQKRPIASKSQVAFAAICLIPCLTIASHVWKRDGFWSDAALLKGRYFSKVGYDDLMGMSVRQVGPMEYGFRSESELDLFKDVLSGLNARVGPDSGRLLINPDYGLDYRQYVALPSVLYEFEDRGVSEVSFQFAANYDFRLRQIFNKDINWFYQDDRFADRFRGEFENLSAIRLKDLGERGEVRFFVSAKDYESLTLVYANRRFRAYDLRSTPTDGATEGSVSHRENIASQ